MNDIASGRFKSILLLLCPTQSPYNNIPYTNIMSEQRALNFVLDNKNLIDKTLLINIRIVKVTPKNKLNKDGNDV